MSVMIFRPQILSPWLSKLSPSPSPSPPLLSDSIGYGYREKTAVSGKVGLLPEL